MVGVEEALAAQSSAAVAMTYVSKEKLTKDMQFRGAISDFHPIKEHIINADYDLLLLRSNVDDLYGDGNNFEVLTRYTHKLLISLWNGTAHLAMRWSQAYHDIVIATLLVCMIVQIFRVLYCLCSLPQADQLLRSGSSLMLRQSGGGSKLSLLWYSRRQPRLYHPPRNPGLLVLGNVWSVLLQLFCAQLNNS